jgi:hypothetical protein
MVALPPFGPSCINDQAPVPKAAKTMYDHLRVPYFDALLTIVLLIVAIGLCVDARAPPCRGCV